MVQNYDIENIYYNGLAVDRFARMLNDPTQCYKFYWLDAIITLSHTSEEDFTFDVVFNEMICAVWVSVTKYHLRLGPMVKGEPTNLLERAVHILEEDPLISLSARSQDILLAIKRNERKLKECKNALAKNVPYRLLSSFMDDVGGNDRIWDAKEKIIDYIKNLNNEICLPYTIMQGRGFHKKVHIDSEWRRFFEDNYSIIRSWIRLKKIQFLQDRNPGVPGILYKLDDDHKERKLIEARKLWQDVSEASRKPLLDIYSGQVLQKNAFALDHFVPWSYVADDELWNLTPIDPVLNSSKGSNLPEWGRFFIPFAENQYNMYQTAFSVPLVRKQFDKCRDDNLKSIWASDLLYIENNTEEQFKTVLEKYLYPVYESAKLQGFKQWDYRSYFD